MKTFFRKIFSPKFLIALILILEIAFLVAVGYLLKATLDELLKAYEGIDNIYIIYFVFKFIFVVIGIIFFFIMINKDENPEYKIPWLAFIIFSPIFIAVFYLIFGNTKLQGKEKTVIEETKKVFPKLIEEHDDSSVFNEIDEYKDVFRFLKNTTGLNLSKNNRLTYFKNGELFFPDLIKSLNEAKEFIFIEFFIIAEGKWWNQVLDILTLKAKEGVDVRIIYDDVGSFGAISENIKEILKKRGIDAVKFHPFRPTLSGTLNNRTHRKIVIIDHKIAYTGGMNLADEYANDLKRFGYWKDTMLKVEGPGIYNFIATFLHNYDLSNFMLSDYNKYLNYEYERYEGNNYCFFFGDAPGEYGLNHHVGINNYINLINSAKDKIYISTPYLITPYNLQEALISASKRGVDIKLIVPGIPDKRVVYWMAKGEFKKFIDNGIEIYIYKNGFNHEKQMLVDSKICFIGTINFDFRSLTHHFECGANIYDTNIIHDIEDDFKEMILESNKVEDNFKLNKFKRLVIGILKIFRTLL